MNDLLETSRNSWSRLSDHFSDYIKVYIVTLGLFAGFGLLFTGVALGFFIIAKNVQIALLYVLVIPLLVAFIFAFVYLSTWCGLVTIDSIIGHIGIPLKKRFNAIRPIVMGFVWFNVLFGLFMLGLFIFGILSLGVVFLFWIVTSSFAAFVYLQHQPKGLCSLWISKQMIRGQFFKILGYFVLIYGVIFSIDVILLRSDHIITNITSWLMNFIAAPYFIALKYEIYKHLEYPKKIEVPEKWVIASKVGFVILIISGFLLFKNLVQSMPSSTDFLKFFPKDLFNNLP
ncbi:hypothetical protein A2690_03805 [Candidatus Roizmanbacteria bacterium RIFCSPHIGHO2_01_FULL_39_12b]|uniref:Glycerophosphoryl diester phosphodiesterase membrane domain-containing protein n=1 Tax=Candidatus Roizmanbacteria bacterium RIFCSPHIGHO2_01_FULL_39_12b TaxID=1802030 RepID=A0A1F7GC43_9BACT|nr:MAG: hypothetical protein A2690_03805 [Candidatus Roizmanbacteria bacterium RIFCSPHIGHO2_01_FULL_39_12b]OGK47066.1 MAG: hypothetical protein A3B46_01530 [Candidatus Roizmanbacteria bacterium RIFCSPLOWO2_01_FULL_39_19]